MPEADNRNPHSHSPEHLIQILQSVKTIAMVGASSNEARPSNSVLKFMREKGYDMIPVNPNPSMKEIHGLKVYGSLAAIDRPVDMVQVFRRSDALFSVAQEAIDIGAKVLWSQLGVFDAKAAELAEDAGLTVVMDRCPKIELARA